MIDLSGLECIDFLSCLPTKPFDVLKNTSPAGCAKLISYFQNHIQKGLRYHNNLAKSCQQIPILNDLQHIAEQYLCYPRMPEKLNQLLLLCGDLDHHFQVVAAMNRSLYCPTLLYS